jgi:Protein of unknown function (DUF3617)
VPKDWIVLCACAALAACANPNATNNGSSDTKTSDEAPYPAPGKYEVMVSHDARGMSAAGDSFRRTSSVCVSAEEAANPRRLILAERGDCDETHMYFQSGDISADLRCAAPGSEAKNVPVSVYGVYKRDYWRIAEEIRLFGRSQREERIYRRVGGC